MTRHTTYRGTTVDMDTMRRENEKTVAVGNMGVNAKGDKVSGGLVTKTADEMAREKGRVQSAVVNTGLKGKMPQVPVIEAQKPVTKEPVKATPKKKEVELPSGDIVMEDEKGE